MQFTACVLCVFMSRINAAVTDEHCAQTYLSDCDGSVTHGNEPPLRRKDSESRERAQKIESVLPSFLYICSSSMRLFTLYVFTWCICNCICWLDAVCEPGALRPPNAS